MRRRGFLGGLAFAARAIRAADARVLHAGAATSNITPALGCSLAGGMTDRIGTEVHDELQSKALVLDNGNARLAIVLVDSCAIPIPIVAGAKKLIADHTKIPPSHVLIAATHTHSAPPATHLFQSKPDPKYVDFLTSRIADSVRLAVNRLGRARIGWAVGREPRCLFNRRYFMKPGTIPPDPFGRTTDTVKMNPGVGNANILKPAGPIDPDLGLIAVHTLNDQPIAVLGNYALHYVGGTGPGHISADYFPVWGEALLRAAGLSGRGVVTLMSNACSGNINNVDVHAPNVSFPPYRKIEQVSDMLAPESLRVWRGIRFEDWVELHGSIENVECGVRLPSMSEVVAARSALTAGPAEIRDVPRIYARETLLLAEYPKSVHTPIQGLRIGTLGIGTFPGEAFTELGLEVKLKSPLKTTMMIELANGYNGYIPTTEGYQQGGYETWRAKSSYLEAGAASKMVAAALRRLAQTG
jgi:neutral ceramidase